MTAPNKNTLWARTLVDEIASSGVDGVCLAPGSRSTPLTVAFAEHDQVQTYSHLDERSAAFFALGRGKATGRPTPVVCTSGTAAANFHPAVLEASESRVPLLLLTADRPPELTRSGANQTTDQEKLYGDSVRYYETLPEPQVEARALRSLRVTANRTIQAATGAVPGPVHLNVPFEKPLEPVSVPGEASAEFESTAPLASEGREGPFVDIETGAAAASEHTLGALAAQIDDVDRGLVVCGPADSPTPGQAELVALATATNFPVFADPLSGLRFGPHTDEVTVCGGYDSYLGAEGTLPEPELVLRFGASPTSKRLRKYLASTDATQVLVDSTGRWTEAEFTANQLIEADPDQVAAAVASRVTAGGALPFRERFEVVESRYWELVGEDSEAAQQLDTPFEGALLGAVADRCPAGSTLFVSNSMPVRDLDRFGQPRERELSVLGNRGVSGIDGITSTALGAGTATDGPLVLVIGDVAYYHDMNGLLALNRCDVDATIVVVNNDGGGIFHKLPIESFDPPFTEQFKTPHGLDFAPTGELYDVAFEEFESLERFTSAFESAVGAGRTVLSVSTDGAESHRYREKLHDRVCKTLSAES